jgi:hypothetical protein
MLTPDQFVERWLAEVVATSAFPETDKLVTLPSHRVAEFPLLPETARHFLTQAGLPQSCAPCLTFDDLTDGLRHLWEVFSPGQWTPEERQGLEHYGVIGSDGAGNPICVDEREGRVVLVEHELLFDPKSEERRVTFVNSSIAQLAESLFLVSTLPSSSRLEAIEQIDKAAAAKATFWSYEAIDLRDDCVDEERQTTPWWKFW